MDEIKDAISSKTAIIGQREVFKALKNGTLKEIIISTNPPESVAKDIARYSKIADLKIKKYSGTSRDLGVFCGKPFSISIMGIKGKSK